MSTEARQSKLTTLPLTIPGSSHSYDIIIGQNNLAQLPEQLKKRLSKTPQKLLIVTDSNVAPLYLNRLQEALKVEFQVEHIIIPTGEQSKSFEQAQNIYDIATEFNLNRSDAIIALGGGVVGDLAGFCAATYMRGCQFIQVPTTLLAQVDSSVGGKVAINLPHLKNGVGCFYQPHLVWIDLNTLETLPEREFLAGMAEVIKYSLIEESCAGSIGMFEWLNKNVEHLKSILPELIYRCCEIKANVVVQDEKDEKGLRAFLNLGHTFGHAYEEITHYKTYLHGEAVAIGMIDAFTMAVKNNLIDKTSLDKVVRLYTALGLPLKSLDKYKQDELHNLMKRDKKNTGNAICFVLPVEKIGKVTLHEQPY